MAQEPMKKTLTRALVAVCAATFLVASNGLVYAQADDDDDDAPDIKFLRSVLGSIGLQGQGDRSIEYRERSPLVLPPSTELPPPAGEAQPNVANWPVDQDVQRRKQEREARKKEGRRSKDPEAEARQLRPDQLAPGAGSAAARRGPGGSVETSSRDDNGRRLTAQELGYKGGLFGNLFSKGETETAKFTGEPERSSLTDPPVGYRSPSAAQPYGVTSDSAKPKAATSYMDKRTAADEGKQ
jgi:hypothetical protein